MPAARNTSWQPHARPQSLLIPGPTHTGLPADKIDDEHIEAMHDHGMILIKVPKLEKHKSTTPRLIPIKPVEAKEKFQP